MIYKFLLGVAIAFVLASFKLPQVGPHFLSALYNFYPDGFQGLALLLLRVSVGGLFLMHGYPKVTHLREWAESLKMPVYMCFLSAWSMLGSAICLIIGSITLLATLPLLASMLFAIFLHVKEGKPFVAQDPYLIPNDQYKGPLGKGEPPSWEKAFMYCVMLITIAVIGPGGYSLDALIFGR
ncbi:DoxX family protein [Aetokthonos hydrillicola Thurmond2011]|jgi:putative oxidoreductase|uniref:DoxX family protein n=1 Tax=Aetokthonos hydrillicola Thurmond2011 TaxID=2712845 RepID=A0AAP5I8M9_9CYAN|nr:DoxX family protein [Aetokthonos hydrillicola]MBO3458701.1 DoxX family protein [Aetokthonos hydrillicola CCALA 1050]MBW4589906.1 DoxX family protein [Aetokthonos hydrillicola CCALA 1050]MDR9896992.1 DoxX family protein [Aetokthonos hydrillicola Thurmond2011]